MMEHNVMSVIVSQFMEPFGHVQSVANFTYAVVVITWIDITLDISSTILLHLVQISINFL